jgi:ankyrin repeat protein
LVNSFLPEPADTGPAADVNAQPGKELIVNPSLPTRAFREHTDLDQLKRQAKELLEAFRAGDPAAISEVNAHFRAADADAFALHDAQLVLARAYGFESWPKLKAYVDGVTAKHLVDAVRAGNLSTVQAMLRVRPELVNMDMGADEHRPIHYAVVSRSPEMTRLLMQSGADARKGIHPHREATGALTLATERGYDEIVAIIREEEQRRSGARDIHPDGWTPLHVAACRLDAGETARLLEHGADPNSRTPGGSTPLHLAASGRGWGDADGRAKFQRIARVLSSHGAEMGPMAAVALGDADWIRTRHAQGSLSNATSDYFFFGAGGLLSVAVLHDRPEMLSLLLELGFDPDERIRVGGTDEIVYSAGGPLYECVMRGKRAMAELLLAKGADPNASVFTSGSALFRAYSRKAWDFVKLLEQHGGFLDAISAGFACQTDAARQLLADEAAGRLRPHAVSPGSTVAEDLVWTAAGGGDPEIVRMALERIDWPRDDTRWLWSLWQAFMCDGEIEHGLASFRLLLDRADPNLYSGRTMLHTVMARGEKKHLPFAEMLLDRGARMDIRDELLGSTALGWACRWGRVHFVKLLLKRGADPVEADAEPWATPTAWAQKMGHAKVLRVLQGYGPE